MAPLVVAGPRTGHEHQPGDRARARGVVLSGPGPDLGKSLLQNVVRISLRAEHAAQEAQQSAGMAVVKLRERGTVAARDEMEQLGV